MKAVLRSTNLPPDKNIFLYYAIGKELEDLGEWDEAFRYYQMAGDAATAVADYDVGADLALIDTIIEDLRRGMAGGRAGPGACRRRRQDADLHRRPAAHRHHPDRAHPGQPFAGRRASARPCNCR